MCTVSGDRRQRETGWFEHASTSSGGERYTDYSVRKAESFKPVYKDSQKKPSWPVKCGIGQNTIPFSVDKPDFIGKIQSKSTNLPLPMYQMIDFVLDISSMINKEFHGLKTATLSC